MKLQKIRIKNFRGYGEANNDDGFYEFNNLDNSLVVLNGFNGFGKTSFYEAIEWCLTDRISRLEALKRDVYDIPTLKQSHYLKFFPINASEESRKARCIEVELIFDNLLRIKRTSNCNFLWVSNNDRYQSSLTIQVGSEEPITYVCDSVENRKKASNELAKFFVNKFEPEWEDQVINAHFMGQENINQFLRSNKPSERRSALMRLLNLNEIETIFEKSNIIKNSTRLDNTIKNLAAEIAEHERKLSQITELFSLLNFGSMEEYLEELSRRFDALKVMAQEYGVMELVREGIPTAKVTLSECPDYFRKLSLKRSVIVQQEQSLTAARQELTHIKDQVDNIKFLEKRIEFDRLKSQLDFLLSTDVKSLEDKRKEYEQTLSLLDKDYRNNLTRKQTVETLRVPYKNTLETYIENSPPKINDNFWTWFNDEKRYLEEHCSTILTIGEETLQPKILLDIESLKSTYMSLQNQLSGVVRERLRIEDQYRLLSELNSDYSLLLEHVKDHILEHRPEINQCPVCLNDNFSSSVYQSITDMGDAIPDKLLKIIDYTISSGNEKVSILLGTLNELKQKEIELQQSIHDSVLALIREKVGQFVTEFEKAQKQVIDSIELHLQSLVDQNSYIRKQNGEVELSLRNYNEIAKKLKESLKLNTDENITDSLISLILSQTIESIDGWNQESIKQGLFTVIPTMDEVNAKLITLKENEKVLTYYKDQSLIEKEFAIHDERINQIRDIKGAVDNVLLLKVPEEQEDLLQTYVNNQIEILEKKRIHDEYVLYQTQSKKIYANTYSIQQALIVERLSNNNLMNWIYKQINPHPFFKEIRMEERNRGINIKDSSGGIFLDHIFSSAQLNILALSIFLGIGLTQQFSKWDQLFLDDPIQSMDDVKILTLIDVLRAIMDSKVRSKNLIISTHDDNFAKLLSIKFRNKSYTQYNFTGYGKEGPIYTEINY